MASSHDSTKPRRGGVPAGQFQGEERSAAGQLPSEHAAQVAPPVFRVEHAGPPRARRGAGPARPPSPAAHGPAAAACAGRGGAGRRRTGAGSRRSARAPGAGRWPSPRRRPTRPPPRRRGRPGTWSRCSTSTAPCRAGCWRRWRRCCRRAPGRRPRRPPRPRGRPGRRTGFAGVSTTTSPCRGGGRDPRPRPRTRSPWSRAGRAAVTWSEPPYSGRSATTCGRPRWVLAIRQALSGHPRRERHRVRGPPSSASADSNRATPGCHRRW